jgi:ubiquinone/menaquinone biosynthesis C-methylase UbiE
MKIETDIVNYYARRAPEYDRVYLKPERQGDLALLSRRMRDLLAGLSVLELPCGTGYWTEAIADVTKSIVAADISEEMLAIARTRAIQAEANVRFVQADAYRPDGAGTGFDAALVAFWWSHVPHGRIEEFLQALHRTLVPGALVVLCDNLYSDDSNTPLHRTDDEGNTFQLRSLEDGSQHEVLKNFPDEEELRRALPPTAFDVRYEALPYYWLLMYRVSGEAGRGL